MLPQNGFNAVGIASVSLLSRLSVEGFSNFGNADGRAMFAWAAAFIITGHEIWHKEIINEKHL